MTSMNLLPPHLTRRETFVCVVKSDVLEFSCEIKLIQHNSMRRQTWCSFQTCQTTKATQFCIGSNFLFTLLHWVRASKQHRTSLRTRRPQIITFCRSYAAGMLAPEMGIVSSGYSSPKLTDTLRRRALSRRVIKSGFYVLLVPDHAAIKSEHLRNVEWEHPRRYFHLMWKFIPLRLLHAKTKGKLRNLVTFRLREVDNDDLCSKLKKLSRSFIKESFTKRQVNTRFNQA